MNQQLLKNTKVLFIGLLLVVFTIVGFYAFFSELRKKSKASENALLTMTSDYATGAEAFTVTAQLDPQSNPTLSSFDLRIQFPADKVELANADFNENIKAGDAGIQMTSLGGLEGTNIVHLVGFKTGSFTKGVNALAVISFKIKAGAAIPFNFTWGQTTLETGNVTMQPYAVGATQSSSSSSDPGGGPTGEAKVIFQSDPEYALDDPEIPLVVKLSTGSKQITSAGIIFTFDTAKLTHLKTEVNTAMFDPSSIVSVTGNKVSMTLASKVPRSGDITLGTVKFKPKALGEAQFVLNLNDSSVYTSLDAPANIIYKGAPYYVIKIVKEVTSSSSSSSSSGGGGTVGETAENNGDLLNINSTTFDKAPIRYEQKIALKKDENPYELSASAMVYVNRGRGVTVILACGEADCGNGKKLNDPIGQTPRFPVSDKFQIQTSAPINIPDAGDGKLYVVRIFVEDGSEADFDYVSLIGVHAGEQLQNNHFENDEDKSSPRKYPEYWDRDEAADIYGTVDPNTGTNGSLYINSSSRE